MNPEETMYEVVNEAQELKMEYGWNSCGEECGCNLDKPNHPSATEQD